MLDANRPQTNPLSRPYGMSDQDWIDHLEFVVSELTEVGRNAPPVVDGAKLTRRLARTLAALQKYKGQVASHEAILASVYFDRPEADWPDIRSLQVAICQLRSRLADAGSPIKITTASKVGYMLTDPRT